MKQMKRLAASAVLLNHERGYLVLQFTDLEDGGTFDLHPFTDDDAIYLPDPNMPGYRLAITGSNPNVLDRVGRALQALARKQRDGEG